MQMTTHATITACTHVFEEDNDDDYLVCRRFQQRVRSWERERIRSCSRSFSWARCHTANFHRYPDRAARAGPGRSAGLFGHPGRPPVRRCRSAPCRRTAN